jgi:anti-anti-sigma regulatory factor
MPQLKVRKEPGVAVLAAVVVPLNDGVVREALAALTRARCRHAILDLDGIPPHPALVKILLALRRDVLKREGRLVLCGLSRETAELFQATWLLGLFEVRPDVDSALGWLRSDACPGQNGAAHQPGRNGYAPAPPNGHPPRAKPTRARPGRPRRPRRR